MPEIRAVKRYSLGSMNMVRALSFVLFVGSSSSVFAGGDFVEGNIAAFSDNSGEYDFRFVQTEHRPPLIKGCSELRVSVRYERVPWYSWLPFVSATHPGREQTTQAAAFLKAAQTEARSVNFGYMGYGLRPVGDCAFVAKALSLIHEGGRSFVLAFHDFV